MQGMFRAILGRPIRRRLFLVLDKRRVINVVHGHYWTGKNVIKLGLIQRKCNCVQNIYVLVTEFS